MGVWKYSKHQCVNVNVFHPYENQARDRFVSKLNNTRYLSTYGLSTTWNAFYLHPFGKEFGSNNVEKLECRHWREYTLPHIVLRLLYASFIRDRSEIDTN